MKLDEFGGTTKLSARTRPSTVDARCARAGRDIARRGRREGSRARVRPLRRGRLWRARRLLLRARLHPRRWRARPEAGARRPPPRRPRAAPPARRRPGSGRRRDLARPRRGDLYCAGLIDDPVADGDVRSACPAACPAELSATGSTGLYSRHVSIGCFVLTAVGIPTQEVTQADTDREVRTTVSTVAERSKL